MYRAYMYHGFLQLLGSYCDRELRSRWVPKMQRSVLRHLTLTIIDEFHSSFMLYSVDELYEGSC